MNATEWTWSASGGRRPRLKMVSWACFNNRSGRMNYNKILIQKVLQIVFYSLLGSLMIHTGYIYLNFPAGAIQNLKFSDLFEAWPIFFLGISCALLWISVFLCIRRPHLAARLALVAAAPGCFYY